MSYDYLFKFIIIGDQSVGKSSLLQRFTQQTFQEHSLNPTYGIEFVTKDIDINGKRIKLQIWDTAGTEKYKSLARSYYRSAVGALIVYDVTRRSSFLKAQDWLNEARTNGHANINFLLIGNKCDMSSDREVTIEEGKDFAFTEGFNFIETSAKAATNVEKAFYELSYRILEKISKGQILVDADGSNGVKSGGSGRPAKAVVNLGNSITSKPQEEKCCNLS